MTTHLQHKTQTAQSIRLGHRTFDRVGDLPAALIAAAHRDHVRPVCLCRAAPGGVGMYIARTSTGYTIKRMPDTGHLHDPTCASWAPPEAVSGRGPLTGRAIATTDDGATALRLAVPLGASSRSAPPPSAGDGAGKDATPSPSKLTLRGLLHYLWDEAGFTHWSPAMQGKRSWKVISYYLRQAAEDTMVGKVGLGGRLFTPEPYNADQRHLLAARRLRQLQPALPPAPGKPARYMLLIAEVKTIEPAAHGHRIIFKHLPDLPFIAPEGLVPQLGKRFPVEMERFATNLELEEGDRHGHLMLIGTFSVGNAGVGTLHSAAVMAVTDQWLPVDGIYPEHLLRVAVDEQRRFTVSLRYNLPPEQSIATLTLTDSTPATVCHISDATRAPADLTRLTEESGMQLWHWDITSDYMPDLPSPGRSSKRPMSTTPTDERQDR